MATEPLKYLSRQISDNLMGSVIENLERYKSGDFLELQGEDGWAIEMSLQADLSPLSELVMGKDPEAEISNSKLVWKALNHLKPALACENRFWMRLTHVECLEYSRFRWLNLHAVDEKLVKDIKTHFFANTQTRYRDDNAISRLWWNAYIAKLAAPDNQEQALRLILKTADIRSNFIERTRTTSRASISAAIIRIMLENAWVTEKERNFRLFMIALNRLGGGKVFEMWADRKMDEFMSQCLAVAWRASAA